MRFVWVTMPKPPLGGGAETPVPAPEPGREKLKEQEADLKFFLERLRDLKPAERRQFVEKATKWNYQQAIDEMRRAGIDSAEDEKDPLKKHLLLSSAFLEREPNASKMIWKVNFNNQLAEYNVGAGDMLPPTVSVIKVYNESGNIVCDRAFRAVHPKTGRIGYYDEAVYKESGRLSYIPVFSGFRIEVVETQQSESPVVMRRTMSEHVENYQRGPRVPSPGYAPAGLPEGNLAAVSSGGRRRAPAGESVEASLAALSGGFESMHAVSIDRQKIALTAQKYAGVAREEFRTAEVKGGRLACAKVVSTILVEAGFLDKVITTVDEAASALLAKGWTYAEDKPEPGDVIVWAPLTKKIPGAIDDAGPQYITGHKHIGIAIGPNRCISNSSAEMMPREHAIYTGRPVEAILKPPRHARAESPRMAAGPAEKRPVSPEYGPDLKLNARIEKCAAPYESIIADASERFNVPVNLIKSVIFQESGGDAMICSPVGAGGLMQLMPKTARGFGLTEIYPVIRERTAGGKYRYRLDPRDERANPERNIMAGTRLLSQLLKRYDGNVEYALAAYNWGEGNMDKYLRGEKNMPQETAKYIRNIPRMYGSLNQAGRPAEAAPEEGTSAVA